MLNLKWPGITAWLQSTLSGPVDAYSHRLLVEEEGERERAVTALRRLVLAAHEDARRRLDKVVSISLDPLGEPPQRTIVDAYPQTLPLNVKKGYFGEILAGIIVENFSPFGESRWNVPAFFFRYHELAFDQLERWRETGARPAATPGQTGDDCLAFVSDGEGIVAGLVCEAKCTHDHDAGLIVDAHKKVSAEGLRPVGLRRMIEILQEDAGDPQAAAWATLLSQLYARAELDGAYKRFDLVSYVCGQRPVQRPTWMPTTSPHRAYTAQRDLEAVEVHLHDVDGLILEVYGPPPTA